MARQVFDVRPARAVRRGHRRRARGAHLLPAGPRRRPHDQRRAGEAAGAGARRARRGAARRGRPAQRRRGAACRRWRRPSSTDTAPLDVPVEEEFRVGTMALAWDGDAERVVIEAQAVTEEGEDDDPPLIDDDDEDGPPLLRVRLTGAAARAFAKRALAVVAAGRPPCPFCGRPLDAGGPRLPAGQRLPTLTVPPAVQRPAADDLVCQTVPGERAGRRHRPGAARARRDRPSRAGSSTPPTPRCSARSPDGVAAGAASTSRSRGSGRCGTSPTARSPAARSRPTSCPRRPAGTSCRRPCCATGRSAPGMCQLWVDEPTADVELVDVVPPDELPAGWLRVLDALGRGGRPVRPGARRRRRLRRMAVLDVVVNNADRKGGHVLPRADGRVHGRRPRRLASTSSDKLRTVLWGWAGEPLPADAVEVLERLRDDAAGRTWTARWPRARGLLLAGPRCAPDRARGSTGCCASGDLPGARRATGRRSPGRRSDASRAAG